VAPNLLKNDILGALKIERNMFAAKAKAFIFFNFFSKKFHTDGIRSGDQ
jgi:hypothetical protein